MKARPMSIARLPQRYTDSQFYTTKIPFYAQFQLVGGDGNVLCTWLYFQEYLGGVLHRPS